MIEWSSDNVLTSTAAAKKGGGVNAILSLLQDLNSFQEKVGATAEAQDVAEYKQKLGEFQQNLTNMAESLLDMARGGIQSVRQPPQQAEEQPVIMNDNTIEQIP